ncbi:hypothetical protein DAPPUDRAFT_335346 [Daphnia pulex]|uniref:Uncharacterized protein n=1 Tax=Daphnia pulex TaxID=6669 RepID=E9HXJ6_DAPPU|nr:hypothetical protein DAPPUDRAFT_335346 [Daphnia pulex]|eukprot:EFX63535.1 hypothetical protein DAPPUDRAFT_335346 [Daphnia pulex]
MTWRWLPLIDQVVDSFMSRNSDSKIISREEAAVREWLVSDRIFQVMRDHPHHCIYAILGGMWGVKMNQDRAKFALAFKKMFSVNHLHKYDYDQFLLKEHIWPIAKTR